MPGSKREDYEQTNNFSQQIKMKLQYIDPRIDYLKLREFIVDDLLNGRSLSDLSSSEQKAIEFRVQVECEHDLERHIKTYVNRIERQTDSQAREDILLKAQEEYTDLSFWEENLEDIEKISHIDNPVAKGRLTSLHLVAVEGDLEEVKRLIRDGANPNVKDSGGLTPLDRAEMMGQIDVVQYLRSICSV